MGEGGGVGQEVEEGVGLGAGGVDSGLTGGPPAGVGDAEGLPVAALVEVLVGDGLGVARIGGRALDTPEFTPVARRYLSWPSMGIPGQ